MNSNQCKVFVGGMGVGLLVMVLLLRGGWQQTAVFLLLWLLPTLTWSTLFTGENLAENLLIAAGLILLLNALLALLISYLPGPIPAWLLQLAALLLALAPLLRQNFIPPPFSFLPLPSSFILLLALLLRWPNLGYKEIQGDEGVILVRAAAVLLGEESELFLHQKGPVEILLPMLTWGVAGEMNDFWARLPFLWAGLLGVAAIILLARRWFNQRTGLMAGGLFAIMGFAVAFSRIIQYQTLVMLWGMLALLAATRYAQRKRPSDLTLTAVFLAAGLLAHYDTILVAPAIIWILWRGESGEWRLETDTPQSSLSNPQSPALNLRIWITATLLGTAVLALFYFPFALNPNFARTIRYLLNDRVGTDEGVVSGSGSAVWRMITFYNSTYYVAGLIILMLLGLWLLWRRREGMTAVLYFLVPTIFYTFIVSDPRTHVYTIFPGAIVLAAVGAKGAWQWLRPTWRRVGGAMALLWFVISGIYVYLLFVDVTPERQRTWTENRPSFYLTTWTEPPRYGLFGFPHQAGWRVVPDLIGKAPYASNEEEEITNWYMAQSPRTHCPNFDYFVLVENAQDEIPYDPTWLQHLQAEVRVNGRSTLQIYGREAVAEMVIVAANGRQHWLTPLQAAPPTYGGANPVDVVLGQQVRLLGYDLDTEKAFAGGEIIITLYWQPLLPFERNFQVFTHLYDGVMWGQDDSAPECAINPTTRWQPGQIIADPHIIPIAADAPVAEIPLLVGMYDLLTGERLAVPGTGDNVVELTAVSLTTP